MLDASNGEGLIDTLWDAAKSHAVVPVQDRRSLQSNINCPTRFESRRAYGRYAYGDRGIMLLDGEPCGVYISDVSRTGVGFFSPSQLFPGKEHLLVLPGPRKVRVKIRRCRREGESSYRCGGVFAEGYLPLANELSEGGSTI